MIGRSVTHWIIKKKPGARDGIRTHDLLITNQLLCRLSYPGCIESI